MQFAKMVKESLEKGTKIWKKSDVISAGYTIDEVMPWLKDWEKNDLAVIYSKEEILFEAKQFSDYEGMLAARINRFYAECSPVWSKDDIIKHDLTIEQVTPWLKEWEKRGYIRFNGKDDNFFEVLKEIN